MSLNHRSPVAWMFWAFTLAGCVLPITLGCSKGGGKNTATITGKVLYNGKPVTGGSLVLHPASGGQFPITLRPDGTFSATGAPHGDMKVTVNTEMLHDMTPAVQSPDGKTPPRQDLGVYVAIPEAYMSPSTTPLTWKIEKGTEDRTFELKD